MILFQMVQLGKNTPLAMKPTGATMEPLISLNCVFILKKIPYCFLLVLAKTTRRGYHDNSYNVMRILACSAGSFACVLQIGNLPVPPHEVRVMNILTLR